MDYHATDAMQSDTTIFVSNASQSLFSDCTVAANGIKRSSPNGNLKFFGNRVLNEQRI